MPRAQLLVLANSHKKLERCVAGRQLILEGGQPRLGGWVRPVSRHGEGELAAHERRYDDGAHVQVLDAAEVNLADPVGNPCQPENWRIGGAGDWKKLPRPFPALSDPSFEERPLDLWLEPGQRTDRTAHTYLLEHPPRQSLAVVRPQHFRLHGRSSSSPGRLTYRRCMFSYNGTEHDLALTDPVLLDRCQQRTPGPSEAAVEMPLPCGDALMICVSLTGVYNGYHYKVVATVFEGVPMSGPSPGTGLLTVGHSNHSVDHFLRLLSAHSVTALADVRSRPYSRFSPQYNREALREALEAHGIRYVFLGRELGARREEPECYVGGKAKYDLIARTALFREGLARIRKGALTYRVALLCAEKDPLTCHRMILICRHLRSEVAGIGHIRDDGSVETQEAAEARLLALLGLPPGDLFLSRPERIEQAYDKQAERIAFTATAPADEGELT